MPVYFNANLPDRGAQHDTDAIGASFSAAEISHCGRAAKDDACA
jgi:hypothetical protein